MNFHASDISEDDRKLIHNALIFKGVDLGDLGHLMTECDFLDIPAGVTLIAPNVQNEYFYVLLTGALKVHLDADISEHFIPLQPGECAGELSVIDGANASALVIVARDSRVMRIREETLWRLVRASHAFARNLLYVLAKRMRNNNLAIIDGLRQQQELEYIANVDGLTGLFNRRWMNDFFKRQIARALKDNKPMALLLADLDHFKKINDVYGHMVGDEVLCAVASILTQNIRPSDLLARFGGEEFALILPDTSPEEAYLIAERIRATIDATHIKIDDEASRNIHVTLSIGITNLLIGDEINNLLTRADQALYTAKNMGRNCVKVG